MFVMDAGYGRAIAEGVKVNYQETPQPRSAILLFNCYSSRTTDLHG
jgi:hypothetical protein